MVGRPSTVKVWLAGAGPPVSPETRVPFADTSALSFAWYRVPGYERRGAHGQALALAQAQASLRATVAVQLPHADT